jgi:16S rRNA (cytosine1402-N4)-methyltransferase
MVTNIRHIPVLLREAVSSLHIAADAVIVDVTLGSGGHSLDILRHMPSSSRLIAFDRDGSALERFRARISDDAVAKEALASGRMKLICGNFADFAEKLDQEGIGGVSAVLADLGFSSDQMDDASRGLSFIHDGPLDMRLDQRGNDPTAREVVNEYDTTRLIEMLRLYGDESRAVPIARSIVEKRKRTSIETTHALAEIVQQALPKRFRSGKIHPATKTFQALRIEVNREAACLEAFLSQAVDRLISGGRLAIIAFHSGEDRMVKHFFREKAAGCICPKEFPICRCDHRTTLRIVTAKPIIPSSGEVRDNPRSRSAKLRVAEKL